MAVDRGTPPLRRRTRYGALTGILVAAATAAMLFALALGTRYNIRFDLTATREHTLAPRTRQLLERLDTPHRIIISAPRAQVSSDAWQRITDLIAEFDHGSPRISVDVIDASAPTAPQRLAEVIAALAAFAQQDIDDHADALEGAAAAITRLRADLPGIADALNRANDVHARLAELADVIRIRADELADAADAIARARTTTFGDTTLPAADIAYDPTVPALATLSQALLEAARILDPNDPAAPPTTADRALATRARLAANAAVMTADRLDRLQPLEPLLLARALQARAAVLIASERGTIAIDFNALFRSTGQDGASEASLRFAGEDLIATALAGLTRDVTPLIVIVHADAEPILINGHMTPRTRARLGVFLERLRFRRFDIAEWNPAADPVAPVIPADRPVVYMVLSAPPRPGADPSRAAVRMADRPAAIDRLAEAIDALIQRGANLLVSIEPSELPAIGAPDPIALALRPLGVDVHSGTPLIERLTIPGQGPAISAYIEVRAASDETPIGRAIAGLATILHWPSPITTLPEAPGTATIEPILTIPASDTTWGEARYLGLRSANAARPFQAIAMRAPPTPDPERDRIDGPWTVAVAITRTAGPSAQRAVIVAAPGWYQDLYTQQTAQLEGRAITLFPGNAELLEASLAWLAGLDEMIARSPQTQDIPRIGALTRTQLALIRVTLILILPLAALTTGAIILRRRR